MDYDHHQANYEDIYSFLRSDPHENGQEQLLDAVAMDRERKKMWSRFYAAREAKLANKAQYVKLKTHCSRDVSKQQEEGKAIKPSIRLFEFVNNNWRQCAPKQEVSEINNLETQVSFVLEYRFAELQPLRFVVESGDKTTEYEAKLNLAQILAAKGLRYCADLVPIRGPQPAQNGGIEDQGTASLMIEAESQTIASSTEEEQEVPQDETLVEFIIKGMKGKVTSGYWFLVIKQLSSWSDLTASNNSNNNDGVVDEEDNASVIYNSEPIACDNYIWFWRPFILDARKVCNGDYQKPLLFEFWQLGDLSNVLVGKVKITFQQILDSSNKQKEFDVARVNPGSESKKNKPLLRLAFNGTRIKRIPRCPVDPKYSFLDYMKAGCEINVAFAIDFTTIHSTTRNISLFEKTIDALGSVLAPYASQRLMMLGYGGKPPGTNEICHVYNLATTRSNFGASANTNSKSNEQSSNTNGPVSITISDLSLRKDDPFVSLLKRTSANQFSNIPDLYALGVDEAKQLYLESIKKISFGHMTSARKRVITRPPILQEQQLDISNATTTTTTIASITTSATTRTSVGSDASLASTTTSSAASVSTTTSSSTGPSEQSQLLQQQQQQDADVPYAPNEMYPLLDDYLKNIQQHATKAAPSEKAPGHTITKSSGSSSSSSSKYHVLVLLVTNDCININRTMQAFADASFLPLSIIVIGIGTTSFKALSSLSDKLKDANDEHARRHAVQFVRLNDFTTYQQLASAVLSPIPRQIQEYMTAKGIHPSS